MSSVSNKRDLEVRERVERVLETIPSPENQVIVRTWLQERRAIGPKASTLLIHVNCLRGSCAYPGAKRLQDAVRMDVIGYVNNAKSMRRYRSVKVDGSSGETEKPIHRCMRTLAQRKEVLKPSLGASRAGRHGCAAVQISERQVQTTTNVRLKQAVLLTRSPLPPAVASP